MKAAVQNLVVMARVAPALLISELALREPFDKVGKRAMHWLSLRVGPKGRYCALYPNGRALATGCTTVREATECFSAIWNMLPPELRAPAVADVEIQNIVAVGDLGRQLPLDQLSLARPDVIEFEPEQFPGALASLGIGRGKALLFQSGKVVLTGTKTLEELEAASAAVERLVAEVM